jgi:hypothetical protein
VSDPMILVRCGLMTGKPSPSFELSPLSRASPTPARTAAAIPAAASSGPRRRRANFSIRYAALGRRAVTGSFLK